MSKHLFVSLVILCLFLATPLVTPVQAQTPTVTRTGATLTGWASGGEYINLWAFKDTIRTSGQPTRRVSAIRFALDGPGNAADRVRISEYEVQLPGDPDLMSVSRDLGWAGVDNTVWLLDRNSGKMVEVEFHVYWWAVAPKVALDPWFGTPGSSRWARLDGSITVHGPNGFTIRLPGHYTSYGWTLIWEQTFP